MLKQPIEILVLSHLRAAATVAVILSGLSALTSVMHWTNWRMLKVGYAIRGVSHTVSFTKMPSPSCHGSLAMSELSNKPPALN